MLLHTYVIAALVWNSLLSLLIWNTYSPFQMRNAGRNLLIIFCAAYSFLFCLYSFINTMGVAGCSGLSYLERTLHYFLTEPVCVPLRKDVHDWQNTPENKDQVFQIFEILTEIYFNFQTGTKSSGIAIHI